MDIIQSGEEIYEFQKTIAHLPARERGLAFANVGWAMRSSWLTVRRKLLASGATQEILDEAEKGCWAMCAMILQFSFEDAIAEGLANKSEEVEEFEFSDESMDRIMKLIQEKTIWARALEERGLM